MYQTLREVLAIHFSTSNAVVEGDVVEIVGDLDINKPSAAGSLAIVGTVDRVRGAKFEGGAPYDVTVATGFRERRDDRTAGAAVAVGPFVFDTNGQVVAYDAQTHSPAAIRGLAITHATAKDQVVQTLEY
jgi:hypothetical protein